MRLTTADILLYLVVIISLPLLYNSLWQHNQGTGFAEIRVGNNTYQKIDLSINQLINVPGKLGNSVLEVVNNKIRFKESPCIAKRCIHSGWLGEFNTVTACLPNGVSVSLDAITMNATTNQFDSINF